MAEQTIEPGKITRQTAIEIVIAYFSTSISTPTPTPTPIPTPEPMATPEPTPISIITGSVYITSNPQGAEIFIDNIDTGLITNTIVRNLSLGSHNFKVVKRGYYERSTYNFPIYDNALSEISLPLIPVMSPTP